MMNIPLARKYRPQTFNAFIGQETTVRILKNAIQRKQLAHAFLFSGVRGVGKTTIARILAKAVNCDSLNPPCDQCSSCIAIRNNNHLDVYEIDSASKTGVNDIRDIIEGVDYKPTVGHVKVYILDEVHMLSTNAFNALLKTLEEPPMHVIFIFATTEVHKVPKTIISRCQRFDLFRISHAVLVNHFQEILTKENIAFEISGLEMIARASDGSVRDGLSMLDQAIVLSEGKVLEKDVESMLGLANDIQIADLMDAIFSKNTLVVLQILDKLTQRGCDPYFLLHMMLSCVANLAKLHFVSDFLDHAGLSSYMKEFFQKWKLHYHFRQLSRMSQILEKASYELRYACFPYELMMMTIMRMIYAMDLPFPDESSSCVSQPFQSELKDDQKFIQSNSRDTNVSPEMVKKNVLLDLLKLARDTEDVELVSYLTNDARLLYWKVGCLIFAQLPSSSNRVLITLKNILEKSNWMNCNEWHVCCELDISSDKYHGEKIDTIKHYGTNFSTSSSFICELNKYLPEACIISLEEERAVPDA